MITSQILTLLDSSKRQKPKYYENEKKKLIRKLLIINIKGYNIAQNSFLAEVTSKITPCFI